MLIYKEKIHLILSKEWYFPASDKLRDRLIVDESSGCSQTDEIQQSQLLLKEVARVKLDIRCLAKPQSDGKAEFVSSFYYNHH